MRTMFRLLAPTAAALFFATTTLAQTFTDCNPLNSTCPDNPALGTTYATQFNKSQSEFDPSFWNVTAGKQLITFGDDGAELAVQKQGDSVTVKSNFYIFWGTAEILFRAAKGQGIISTMILLSDDLDEIDWEIFGGNTTHVSNNYYGWGNISQFNSEHPPLAGPQDDFHNYTIDWTQERIQLIVNGAVIREIGYQAAGLYPQTPCRIQFGIWCAGCSENHGTVEWAGGEPDWKSAPYTMNVKSVRVTDGTTNSSTYSYGDHSGHWESIKVTPGPSEAYQTLHKLTTKAQVQQHWQGLSTGGQIGIACGVLGALALAGLGFAFYCVKQRRRGAEEKRAQDKQWDEQESELMEYRTMMAKGNFATSRQSVMMEVKGSSDLNIKKSHFSRF